MISIIVPVYNVEAYLPQCLDSLIGQTYKDIEIICVNDGATDGSLKILEEYAAKDDRIQVFTQDNQGVSAARNLAIEKAHGEWMMFVDSDDWMDLDVCEKLMAKATPDLNLSFFPYIREFNNSSEPKYILGNQEKTFVGNECEELQIRLIAPIEDEKIYPDKLNSFTTLWGKLYKTDIIKENKLTFVPLKEIGTGEDLLFNVQYFKFITKAILIPSIYYHYRKNNVTSVTKLYKADLYEKWEYLASLVKVEILKYGNPILEAYLHYRTALSIVGLGINETFSNNTLCKKYNAINRILKNPNIHAALQKLPLNSLPLHWKIFFTLAKYSLSIGVLTALQAIKFIISR